MIKLNTNMKMTSRAVEALILATGIQVTEYRHNDYKHIWNINGKEFTSYPVLGRYLLNEINTWMLANGLVNKEILLNAHIATNREYKFFTLSN